MSIRDISVSEALTGTAIKQAIAEGFTREWLVTFVEKELSRMKREYPQLYKLGKMSARVGRREIQAQEIIVSYIKAMPEVPAAQTDIFKR